MVFGHMRLSTSSVGGYRSEEAETLSLGRPTIFYFRLFTVAVVSSVKDVVEHLERVEMRRKSMLIQA